MHFLVEMKLLVLSKIKSDFAPVPTFFPSQGVLSFKIVLRSSLSDGPIYSTPAKFKGIIKEKDGLRGSNGLIYGAGGT